MCNIMFRLVKYDSLLYSENIPLSIQPHKIILSPIKFHVHIYIEPWFSCSKNSGEAAKPGALWRALWS